MAHHRHSNRARHNVTSSLTTGAVIGILQFIAHQRGLPIHQFTPQQVKKASGLGAKIDKDTAKLVASRLFGTQIKSHHEADAALCGLCGCLEMRKYFRECTSRLHSQAK